MDLSAFNFGQFHDVVNYFEQFFAIVEHRCDVFVVFLLVDARQHHLRETANHACRRAGLVGNVGEEYEVMNKLQMLDDKEIPASTLKSWNQYCPQIPLTDIILCDEHYFNNKSVYQKNANEILTSLCVTPKNQINVVIITKEGQVDSNIDLEAECKNIKEQLAKVSGISKGKCKVTILTTYKTHSRHLITNYFRIIHTSCFHLKENQLKADVNTTIASDAFKNSASTTAHLIKLFQEVADAPVKSFGDKKSNFLN